MGKVCTTNTVMGREILSQVLCKGHAFRTQSPARRCQVVETFTVDLVEEIGTL